MEEQQGSIKPQYKSREQAETQQSITLQQGKKSQFN